MLFATSEFTGMDCLWTIVKGKWSFFPKITTMGERLPISTGAIFMSNMGLTHK